MKKKLAKSQTDRKIAGVCGGLGEYLEVDSTLIRLAWCFFLFFYGTGLFAYIVAAIVLPEE